MKSLNEFKLLGNVTRDIELKYTSGGTPIAKIGLATNRRMKKQDETWEDVPEFHNLTAWGKTAEIINQYAHKGSKIFVSGRIQPRKWVDPQNNTHYMIDFRVEDFILLSPKQEAVAEAPAETPAPEGPPTEEPPVDEGKDKGKKKGKGKIDGKDEENINPDDIPF